MNLMLGPWNWYSKVQNLVRYKEGVEVERFCLFEMRTLAWTLA